MGTWAGKWAGAALSCVVILLLAATAEHAGAAATKLVEGKSRLTERADQLAALTDELRATPALATQRVRGQKRHALVIGVNSYEELTPLNKAVGDSTSIAATLAELGFDVVRIENPDADAMDEAVDSFIDRLERGDVAFFFFAGHGVSFEQRNFLLPSDMPALDKVRESGLARNAVDAGDIVARINERGVEIAFVVLDACRDNPFPPDDDTRSVRAYGGLARMTPQRGAFVIYSAGVGQKALDRLGPEDGNPNSVFTRTFWPILKTPGMPVVEIAKRTQVEVSALAATVPHEQAPAYYDQVIGQFYLKPPQPRLFGLVVGIDDYGAERYSLKGAVNDARRITSALQAAGAIRVETLVDYDARPRFIEYVWRDLLEEAEPGDTIVFTYAGQSSYEPEATPGSEADGRDEFLIVSGKDSLEKSVKDGIIDPTRTVSDEAITAWMADAARKNVNVVLLIDGCHGGGLLDREFANVSFFGASQERETSQERRFGETRHGLASFVFANAIEGAADFNGDGFVTQRELFAYADQHVFRISRGRQNPLFLPSLGDSGSGLVLFTPPAQSAKIDLTQFWPEMPRFHAPRKDR